jgi:hypothetical protein
MGIFITIFIVGLIAEQGHKIVQICVHLSICKS